MKNKKKVKVATSNVVAAGVFKKRLWPWLFVLAAAILPAVFYSYTAIEFFFFKRCNEVPACETFYDYTFHYADAINVMLIIVAALVVVAILCAIIFIRKRSLIITADKFIYTKGKKTLEIPVTSIKGIDFGASCLIVHVPYRTFKFRQLKNKKTLYDALFTMLQAPASVVTQTTTVAPVVTATPAVSTTTVALPTSTEGKIRYFQSLLDAGVITSEQFNKYTNTVLTTDFPTLYK